MRNMFNAKLKEVVTDEISPDDYKALKRMMPKGQVPDYDHMDNSNRAARRARGRNFMIVCDVDKFRPYTNNDRLSIAKFIKHKCRALDLEGMWGYGLHPDTAHLHVVLALHFKEAKTAMTIARMFGVSIFLVLRFTGSMNNMFSYLVHETFGASQVKQVLDPKQIVANFDYIALLNRVHKAVLRNSSEIVKKINSYAMCEINKQELLDKLTPVEYMDNLARVGRAGVTRQEYLHKKYLTKMKNKPIEVYVLDDWLTANFKLKELYGDDAFDPDLIRASNYYKAVLHKEGDLDPFFNNQYIKNKIAVALTKAISNDYYFIDPALNYWHMYKGQPALITHYDDLQDAYSGTRNKEVLKFMQIWANRPSDENSHDVWVTIKQRKQPINCETLIVTSDIYNPFDSPRVHEVGVNSDYIELIKKFRLDKIDSDLDLSNLNISQTDSDDD